MMNEDRVIPKDKQKMVDAICLTVMIIVVFIAITFLSVSDMNHENNRLRIQIKTLQTQLKQSQATLEDVQNTLRIVDEEFGDYVYQVEQERKESE